MLGESDQLRVTPAQMASAFAALFNGGRLLAPRAGGEAEGGKVGLHGDRPADRIDGSNPLRHWRAGYPVLQKLHEVARTLAMTGKDQRPVGIGLQEGLLDLIGRNTQRFVRRGIGVRDFHALARLANEKVETELHVVGRKGLGYFRFTGRAVATSRTDIGDRPTVA